MKTQFDHISLSAQDPEAMKDFLCILLNLQEGERPGFSFTGYFLYAGKDDVHHVSFYTDDYLQTLQRINQLNAQFTQRDVPDSPIKQLFVRAPENLLIEIQATIN